MEKYFLSPLFDTPTSHIFLKFFFTKEGGKMEKNVFSYLNFTFPPLPQPHMFYSTHLPLAGKTMQNIHPWIYINFLKILLASPLVFRVKIIGKRLL